MIADPDGLGYRPPLDACEVLHQRASNCVAVLLDGSGRAICHSAEGSAACRWHKYVFFAEFLPTVNIEVMVPSEKIELLLTARTTWALSGCLALKPASNTRLLSVEKSVANNLSVWSWNASPFSGFPKLQQDIDAEALPHCINCDD